MSYVMTRVLLVGGICACLVGTGAHGADANPFTGKAADLEAKQRELDLSRLDTQILEERAKQADLSQRMNAAPLKTKVELRRIERELGTLVGGAPESAHASRQKGPRESAAPVATPAPAAPRLAAVMRVGAERMAVIEQGGMTRAARRGETAFGVAVGEIGADYAEVNGVRQTASTASATVSTVDRVVPNGTAGGAVGLPTAVLTPGTRSGAPALTPLPLTATGPVAQWPGPTR